MLKFLEVNRCQKWYLYRLYLSVSTLQTAIIQNTKSVFFVVFVVVFFAC